MELIGGSPDYVLQASLPACQDEGGGALVLHYEVGSEKFFADVVRVGLGAVKYYGISYGGTVAKKVHGGTEIHVSEIREACESLSVGFLSVDSSDSLVQTVIANNVYNNAQEHRV